nr:helix-turn-helix domain-containing protein [Chitinophaga sp. CF418]
MWCSCSYSSAFLYWGCSSLISRLQTDVVHSISTTLSVGEIAYELGFEHSQSFSKLFKTKTKLSPLQFRQSFG